jgi:hypothetical protein
VVANLRLCSCQPLRGPGTRTQATREAFAMSNPATRSATTSIAIVFLRSIAMSWTTVVQTGAILI